MNNNETLDWIDHHGQSFPDFARWIADLTIGGKLPRLIDAWAEALADVDPRDAKAVTSRMLTGDDPPIAAYEREQTPAKVRTLSKANRDRRAERDRRTLARQRNDEPAPKRRGGGQSAGELYRMMMELLDANPNMTAREAAEVVMPPPSDDGPRYRCPLCLDTGLVTCWSSLSVRAELCGELDKPGKRRTCVAPCQCSQGARWIWNGQGDPPNAWRGWRSSEATYNPNTHCHAHGGDVDSPDSIQRFREWVVLAKDHYDNRNRTTAFDQFNRGEF